MNRKLYYILFVIVIFTSCGENNTALSTYDFKNQILQGTIAGETWEFKSGNVKDWHNTSEFFIKLFSVKLEDSCSGYVTTNDITLSIPKKVGIYELSFNWNDKMEAYPVSLVDKNGADNGGSKTYIANSGAIEILSINNESGLLSGRMDVRADSRTSVNGNFYVYICR